jgi:hypothetical protein
MGIVVAGVIYSRHYLDIKLDCFCLIEALGKLAVKYFSTLALTSLYIEF